MHQPTPQLLIPLQFYQQSLRYQLLFLGRESFYFIPQINCNFPFFSYSSLFYVFVLIFSILLTTHCLPELFHPAQNILLSEGFLGHGDRPFTGPLKYRLPGIASPRPWVVILSRTLGSGHRGYLFPEVGVGVVCVNRQGQGKGPGEFGEGFVGVRECVGPAGDQVGVGHINVIWSQDRIRNLNMSKQNLLFMAHVYDKCRRTDDCWNTVVQLAKGSSQLTQDERQIFAAAFKAYCTERKMNIRDCNEIEKFEEKEKKQDLTPLKEFKAKLMGNIKEASFLCLDALDKQFGAPSSPEAEITSLKLRGDAAKFLYDVVSGDERKKFANLAHECFQNAHSKAEAKLKPTHPIRLGLALAFSTFLDGVLRDTVSACKVAKKSFDEGTSALDEKDKEFFNDANALLGMLKENLKFWTEELQKNVQ